MDIKDAHETKEFKSVMTMREMHEQQIEKTPCLVYYRLPAPKMRIIEEKVRADLRGLFGYPSILFLPRIFLNS